MLICVQEEPMRENYHILSRDERTGIGEASAATDAILYRYSFIWRGRPADAPAAYEHLLHTMLSLTPRSTAWLAAYPTTGTYQFQTKMELVRRRREGGVIVQDPELATAVVPAHATDCSLAIPNRETCYQRLKSRRLLFFFDTVAGLATIEDAAIRPSLLFFANHRKLWPSKGFLQWLADKKHTVVYSYKPHTDYALDGIVVVGSAPVPTNRLLEQAVIQDIAYTKADDKLWVAFKPPWEA